MKLSIGEIVAADIKKSGLSVTYVAQQINMSRKGLTDILKRDDMSLSQLSSLSELLKRDYFELYKTKIWTEKGIDIPPVVVKDETTHYVQVFEPEISFSVNIYGQLEKIKNAMPEMLTAISEAAEEHGLRLG